MGKMSESHIQLQDELMEQESFKYEFLEEPQTKVWHGKVIGTSIDGDHINKVYTVMFNGGSIKLMSKYPLGIRKCDVVYFTGVGVVSQLVKIDHPSLYKIKQQKGVHKFVSTIK